MNGFDNYLEDKIKENPELAIKLFKVLVEDMIQEIKQEPGVSNNLTNYAIKKLRELRERIVI